MPDCSLTRIGDLLFTAMLIMSDAGLLSRGLDSLPVDDDLLEAALYQAYANRRMDTNDSSCPIGYVKSHWRCIENLKYVWLPPSTREEIDAYVAMCATPPITCYWPEVQEKGVCVSVTCPDFTHPEGAVCVPDTLMCPEGYHPSNGVCVVDTMPPVVCPPGYSNMNGTCVKTCYWPQVQVNGKCVPYTPPPETSCPNGWSLSNGKCVLRAGPPATGDNSKMLMAIGAAALFVLAAFALRGAQPNAV